MRLWDETQETTDFCIIPDIAADHMHWLRLGYNDVALVFQHCIDLIDEGNPTEARKVLKQALSELVQEFTAH